MDRIGINRRAALMMFWNAGFNNEALLARAVEILNGIRPAAEGYYYADDVAAAIELEGVPA